MYALHKLLAYYVPQVPDTEQPRLLNAKPLTVFIALHGMQTRSYDENSLCPSVCPSICLSVKRMHCVKTEERYV